MTRMQNSTFEPKGNATDRVVALTPVLWLLILSACASPDIERVPTNGTDFMSSEVGACLASLQSPSPDVRELDSTSIRLLNWNVQKNRRQHWEQEFAALTGGNDLVLMQEASLREDSINSIDSSRHWSFAPGYTRSGAVSGVLTMSSIRPNAQCTFATVEPLLRTPKATSITQYGLMTTDQTLLVVNIHAINFSMGLGTFRFQFNQVRDVLATHRGPIILSGDFNTWRRGRAEFIDELAKDLGLAALKFADDHRVTRFGHYLDHIYVRGLTLLESGTDVVESSDHNPMFVTLQM